MCGAGWFGDGYIAIGFQSGRFVAISTHSEEIGNEIHSMRAHQQCLNDIAVCESMRQIATCGDDTIQVLATENWKRLYTIRIPEATTFLDELQFTPDGQILSVSTKEGAHIRSRLRTALFSHRCVFARRILDAVPDAAARAGSGAGHAACALVVPDGGQDRGYLHRL